VVELGGVGLWVAVAAAGVAVVAPRADWVRWLLAASVAGSASAVAALAVLLGRGDWAVAYVVDHSRAGIPLPLRLAGLWAGPEGSFLLWSTLVGAAVLVAHVLAAEGRGPAVARAGAAIALAHAVVAAVALDPFDRLAVPAVAGLGLQPVLEHPAMLWHPPLMYAGLVGLLVPALVVATHPGPPGPAARRPLAVALALLVAGLATGARWAYAELGWGGYWGWDPIENAALGAGLVGFAALHARRGRALWLAPALAATWGTVLTRTGAVTSVHAFSDRPGLAVWLVGLGAATTVVLVAGALRTRTTAPAGASPGPLAVEGPGPVAATRPQHPGRRAAARVLLAASGVVALGVLAPIGMAAASGDQVLIAGWFYARALLPVALIGAGLVVLFGQRRWAVVALGSVGGGLAATAAGAAPAGWLLGVAAGAVAAEVGQSLRRSGRRIDASALAHLGVAVLLLGVAGTTGRQDATTTVAAGEPVRVAGVELVHRGIELVDDGAWTHARATVEVDGEVTHPSISLQPVRRVRTNEFGQLFRWRDEVQVAIVDGDASAATYRVLRHPLLPLVWLGAAVLGLGLLCAERGGRGGLGRPSASEAGDAVDRSGADPADRITTGGA
jgi:cytochrome c-type biogenesis protein CcmF